MNERVFKPKAIRMWWAVLFFALCAAVGVWMIADGAPLGWLVLLGSLAFVAMGLSPLFTGKPRLRLTEQGFEVANLFNTRFVRWEEVADWGIYTLNSKRMIGYSLHRPNPTERQWTGYDGSINNMGYTRTNEELLAVLQEYKAKADAVISQNLLAQIGGARASGNLEQLFQIAIQLPDPAKALELLLELAHKGHTGAKLNLGLRLGNEEGLRWVREAARDPNDWGKQARELLPALLLSSSEGLEVNSPKLNEALNLLRQRAEAGETQAQTDLGQLLSRLSQANPALAAEAKHWLEQAGRQPSAEGEIAQAELNRLNLPEWLKPFWGWPVATYGLLALIIGIFVAQSFVGGINPSPQFLFDIGANNPLSQQQGELWRWLTAMILHGNLMHIAFNSFALWQLGLQLEGRAGTAATLTAFMVAGLVGSAFSGFFGNPQVVSVGASGGIFGLIAFLIVYGVRNAPEFVGRLRTQGWLLGLYFLMSAFIPNVDNWGHFGGIVGGLALGLIYSYIPQMVRLVLGSISVLALAWALWRIMTSFTF